MAKIQCNVISYTLKRTVDIDIILPTTTIPEIRHNDVHHVYPFLFPVLYLFHGYGNNVKQWCAYTNVELYAEERQIAVVMLSGENKFYINHEDDLFEDFIANELQEFITNTFPISKRKEDTYIAGLSMGGFGALYHGLKYSKKYKAIGAFSPAVQVDNTLPLENFVNEHSPQIYLSCGEDDFLYQKNLDFVNILKDQNAPYTWVSVPHYSHEWRFWNETIEKFLDWLPRSDHYANQKRKV